MKHHLRILGSVALGLGILSALLSFVVFSSRPSRYPEVPPGPYIDDTPAHWVSFEIDAEGTTTTNKMHWSRVEVIDRGATIAAVTGDVVCEAVDGSRLLELVLRVESKLDFRRDLPGHSQFQVMAVDGEGQKFDALLLGEGEGRCPISNADTAGEVYWASGGGSANWTLQPGIPRDFSLIFSVPSDSEGIRFEARLGELY